MPDDITVTLSRAAWAAFLALCSVADDLLSNRGCNDLDLPDTPANRALAEAAAAANVHLSVAAWRVSPDYYPPTVYQGDLCLDDSLFAYVAGLIRAQVEGESDA